MATETDIPLCIPDFYRGRSVFLTGFSGFLGKLLVEKLLYSCPDLDKIYVLMRHKKGVEPLERVKEVTSSMAFDRIREKYPGVLETKVIPLGGDIMAERLGLSSESEEILRSEVSVVIHCAASVRFDDTLSKAITTNTASAKRIVDLALTMPKLKSLVYVSTAYSNCDYIHIKEEIYPPKADWRASIKISETIDEAHLQILSQKFINGMPNTYVFTKSLAEQVINDYRDQLPVVVVRPSVVINAVKEPIPGWTDSIQGPLIIGFSFLLGLVRCTFVNQNEKCNFIPSDIVNNATIVASWKTAFTWKQGRKDIPTPVYNLCCPASNCRSTEEVIKLIKMPVVMEFLEKCGLNYESYFMVKSLFWYRVNVLFRHMLSSYFIDLVLRMLNKKPVLMKIRRKVFVATLSMSFFGSTTFLMDDTEFNRLLDDMRPEDREKFGWDHSQSDLDKLSYSALPVVKKTILKPLFDDVSVWSQRLKWLYYVDSAAVCFTYTVIACIVYAFCIPQSVLDCCNRFVHAFK